MLTINELNSCNSDFSTSVLNFFQSDKLSDQVLAGIALYFVKYPIEVLATSIFNKLKLTNVSPWITLKSWKWLIFDRNRPAYIRFSYGANVFSPLVEEILQRGLVQSILKNIALLGLNPMPATAVTVVANAALFVIPHHLFPNGQFNRSLKNFVTINTFVGGIFLGFAKEISGGLTMPISLHLFHNLINAELIDRQTKREIVFLNS